VPGPKVFVSYSHRDGKALDQLQRFLRPLEREGLLAAWADTGLHGGGDWRREIDRVLAEATVAVRPPQRLARDLPAIGEFEKGTAHCRISPDAFF
jgi:hypothetical protein